MGLKRFHIVPDREVAIPRVTVNRTSVFRGVARLVDVARTLDARPNSRRWMIPGTDAEALASDWAKIAGDLYVALDTAAEQTGIPPEGAAASVSDTHLEPSDAR